MSNPVTNLEIEDVLSSIRRLVAEGDKLRNSFDRAEPAAATVAGPHLSHGPLAMSEDDVARSDHVDADGAAEQEPSAARFVLTPSLRVVEPPAVAVLLWDEAEPAEGAADAVLVPVLDKTDETPTLAVAEAGSARSADTENMDFGPDLMVADALLSTEAERVDLRDVTQDDAPDDRPSADGRSRLEATIAELEAAITAKPDDWEPDGSEVPPVMDWAATVAEPAFLSSRPGAKPGPIEDAVEVTEDVEPFTTASHRVRRRTDHVASEPSGTAPRTEARHDLSDDLEGSVPPSRADRAAGETNSSEDDILDEETLRNLVIEIVRQELQGTLGERITRNVRKLVRREIYRVLSSQEFD